MWFHQNVQKNINIIEAQREKRSEKFRELMCFGPSNGTVEAF